MNSKTDQHDDAGDASPEGAYDGTDDLNSALAEGEASYVTGEEKKAPNHGTLILFALMILSIGGVYFMYLRTGPSTANAEVVKEQVAAKTAISNFLSSGGANIKTMEQMLRDTEKVVQQFLSYPSMTQVPLRDLRTNPFRVKSAAGTVAMSDAAEKKKREEERQAMLKAVQQLQLNSIMYSEARSACMINNTLQREGQEIEHFTIEKISPTTVIVKNGAYRFELKIQK